MDKKVLVIDDESYIRELMKDFLALLTIECHCAANSHEALHMVRENAYGLIFLDLNLGVENAATVFPRLRPLVAATPVVLMTGAGDSEQEQFFRLGVAGFLGKPFRFEDIRALVFHYLESV